MFRQFTVMALQFCILAMFNILNTNDGGIFRKCEKVGNYSLKRIFLFSAFVCKNEQGKKRKVWPAKGSYQYWDFSGEGERMSRTTSSKKWKGQTNDHAYQSMWLSFTIYMIEGFCISGPIWT